MTASEGLLVRAAAAAQAFVDDVAGPVIADADLHHLLTVRRLRDGETVVLCDGRGTWRLGTVTSGTIKADGDIVIEPRLEPVVSIALAPVKGDRSEWAVAKLTELGCDRIVALATDRGAVRWTSSTAERALERWRRVALEAAAQSRRAWLPEVVGPVSVADLAATGPLALGTIGGPAVQEAGTTVAIGPEGGWSPSELEVVAGRVGLAAQVLRTETAAVAAGVVLTGLRAGTVRPVDISGSSEVST